MDDYRIRIRAHGREHIEIHLHYPLRGESPKKKQLFYLNAYLFTPKSLGGSSGSDVKEQFFDDLTVYTRYKTPTITLSQIHLPECQSSPLFRLKEIVKRAEPLSKINRSDVLYELQTLFNIVYDQMTLLTATYKERVAGAASISISSKEENIASLEEIIENVKKIQEQFETLKAFFTHPEIGDVLSQGYTWVQEGLSLTAERSIASLARRISELGDAQKIVERCGAFLEEQRHLRMRYGFSSFVSLEKEKENEYFIYRDKEIKKWAGSSLHMRVKESNLLQRIGQIMLALAAAIAMGFTITTALLSRRFLPEEGPYWAFLAILAYSLKDRLKEGLRALFSRFIPFVFADRLHLLFDRGSKRCYGQIKEQVMVVCKEKLPSDVSRLRLQGRDTLSRLMDVEDVLLYHKEVYVKSRNLLIHHKRHTALTDVIRMNVGRWFLKMDKAGETLYLWDNELTHVKGQRVYHFTLILSVHEKGDKSETPLLRRYRIVARRARILRIEEVGRS